MPKGLLKVYLLHLGGNHYEIDCCFNVNERIEVLNQQGVTAKALFAGAFKDSYTVCDFLYYNLEQFHNNKHRFNFSKPQALGLADLLSSKTQDEIFNATSLFYSSKTSNLCLGTTKKGKPCQRQQEHGSYCNSHKPV